MSHSTDNRTLVHTGVWRRFCFSPQSLWYCINKQKILQKGTFYFLRQILVCTKPSFKKRSECFGKEGQRYHIIGMPSPGRSSPASLAHDVDCSPCHGSQVLPSSSCSPFHALLSLSSFSSFHALPSSESLQVPRCFATESSESAASWQESEEVVWPVFSRHLGLWPSDMVRMDKT